MIQSLTLIFRWNVALRTRLLALGSLFCLFYFSFMTFTVTALCWFEILPNVYRNDYHKMQNHRTIVAFFFINAVGNCALVLGTNTSIKRFREKTLVPLKPGTGNGKQRKNKTVNGSDASKEHSTGTGKRNKNDTKSGSDVSKEHSTGTGKRNKNDTKSGSDVSNDINSASGEVKVRQRRQRASKNIIASSETDTSADEQRTENGRKVCSKCNYICPPRSHHCIICDSCILKRDHHCFFMTVCVGYFNQKYFIMYCFYMLMGTFYGMALIVMYMKILFDVKFYGPQTFVLLLYDLLLMMWAGQYPGPKYIFLLFLMYGCLTAGLLAAGLWFWQVQIVFTGQTTHEAQTGDKRYTKSRITNFLDVFGKFWILTFLLPLPLPQISNGLYLQYVKQSKHR